MENIKLPITIIGVVVLQIGGFIWWTAQQAATIQNLEETVSQLSSRMAVENTVNTQRDVQNNAQEVTELWDETDDLWDDIASLTNTISGINQIKQRLAVIENDFRYLSRDHDSLLGSGHPMGGR